TPDELRPVTEKQRHTSVDVLRGFALLGILAMNIIAFAFPMEVYFNPLLMGGFEGWDRVEWMVAHLLFDQKFMTIFSMLFGAGFILMAQRASKGRKLAKVHYRRCFWLMLIGMLHAYLIWWGDILFYYAACGYLIYLFRKLKPINLVITGSLAVMVPILLTYGFSFQLEQMQASAEVAQARLDGGEELNAQEQKALQEWEDAGTGLVASEEKLQQQVDLHRGGYLALVAQRVPMMAQMQLANTFTFILWRAGGLMLIGMALMKWGVFSASLSRRAYLILLAIGYGAGLPLAAFSASGLIQNQFDVVYFFRFGLAPNYFASVLVALGHIAVMMLLCQSGALQWLKDRLAAVGRTAFSNYLLQSVICTTLFYGYGLGWFAYWSRAELVLVVVAVWAVQLLISPLWLRRFRFGPAEWVWRSLTYWTLQPMKR
ncbi:MAG: DUF418 domain-containing protein, partial [Acidobacteriota bacterium]